MDFGFSGLLNKFEEHFGARATRGLLVIIGLAVTALCLNILWTKLLIPIFRTIDGAKPTEWSWTAILTTLFHISELLAVFGFASTVLDAYRRRLDREAIDSLIQDANYNVERARELHTSNEQTYETAVADLAGC